MKDQSSFLIHGLVFLFFICIGFYFLVGVWSFVQSIGWKFFTNSQLNFFTNFLILLSFAYGIGRVLALPGIRNFITGFFGNLPLVGVVTKFIDLMSDMKKRGAPEVEFETHPGSCRWQLAWVSREFEENGIIYCSVHVPIQAYPGGFYYSRIPKTDLHFTGRQAWQTFLTCLSGGLL